MRVLGTLCFTWTALLAQVATQTGASPAFEVATVKLSSPDCIYSTGGLILKVDQGRFSARCQTLRQLILAAYDVRADQVTGPDWLSTVRLDIEAKLPDGAPETEVQAMLEQLLADRLRMTVHKGTSERAVYALTVGKNGFKLVPLEQTVEPDLQPPAGSTTLGSITLGLPGSSQLYSSVTAKGRTLSGRGIAMSMDQNGAHFEASRIAALLPMLTEFLHRPVEDRTNLNATYAIRLDLSSDDLKRVTLAADSDPEGSLALFQDALGKLGLRLQAERGQVQTIEVDHIEKVPSEN